jgi:hypothetical protein
MFLTFFTRGSLQVFGQLQTIKHTKWAVLVKFQLVFVVNMWNASKWSH